MSTPRDTEGSQAPGIAGDHIKICSPGRLDKSVSSLYLIHNMSSHPIIQVCVSFGLCLLTYLSAVECKNGVKDSLLGGEEDWLFEDEPTCGYKSAHDLCTFSRYCCLGKFRHAQANKGLR